MAQPTATAKRIIRRACGLRNDCTAWTDSRIDRAAAGATVLADGGYQGTGLLMPHRRKAGQTELRRPGNSGQWI